MFFFCLIVLRYCRVVAYIAPYVKGGIYGIPANKVKKKIENIICFEPNFSLNGGDFFASIDSESPLQCSKFMKNCIQMDEDVVTLKKICIFGVQNRHFWLFCIALSRIKC